MQIFVSNGNQRTRMNLPCSDAELNAAVREIGIEDMVPYAKIRSIVEPQSGLEHLAEQRVNLDELNYYVKRWESLADYQKKKISACAESGEYNSLKDMINLTFQENRFYLIDDFNDMKAVGLRIFMDKHGGIVEKEMGQWDFEKLAKETIAGCKSKITQYGVLLDGGGIMELIYAGKTFPEYLYDPERMLLSVEIQNTLGERDYLYLPADIVSMEKLKCRLGVERFSECSITNLNNYRMPEKIFNNIKQTKTLEDLTALNEMCEKLTCLDETGVERLQMVMDFAKAFKPEEVTAIAGKLQLFETVKDVHDMKSYGNFVINESGLFEVDELIQPFIDYERFGQDKAESMFRNYGFTEEGFVGVDTDLSVLLTYAGEYAEPLEMPEEEYPVLRLYNLLTGSLYEADEYGDTAMEARDMTAEELVNYQEEIQKQIEKEACPGEEARGLMHYYDGNRTVAGKVLDARPTVEEYNGELYGVLECRIKEPLTREELDKLSCYWSGQESDGWGEGFEQRDIRIDEGVLNVHFWSMYEHIIKTEETLKGVVQSQENGLQMQ